MQLSTLYQLLDDAATITNPTVWKRTIQAAMRIQRECSDQSGVKSLIALLNRTTESIWTYELRSHAPVVSTSVNSSSTTHGLNGSVSDAINTTTTDAAGAAASSTAGLNESSISSAARLDELGIEIEVVHQLMQTVVTTISPSTLESHILSQAMGYYTDGLYLVLNRIYQPLHQMILNHLVTMLIHPTILERTLQLFQQFLKAQLHAITDPTTAATSPPPSITINSMTDPYPTSVLLRLSHSAVISLGAASIKRADIDQRQEIFPALILPLFREQLLSVSHVPFIRTHENNPFTSFPALLYKQIVPLFFDVTNPYHQTNIAQFYAAFHEVGQEKLALSRWTALPIFFAFLGDHFEALTKLVEAQFLVVDKNLFYIMLLVYSQIGLASNDPYLIKQSLSLLIQRARKLYSHEAGQANMNQIEFGADEVSTTIEKGNKHSKERAVLSAFKKAITASDSAGTSATRVQRQTTYPDYTLSSWLLYDHIFQLFLNNYELHLVKHNCEQNLETLAREHERFYQRLNQPPSGSSEDASTPSFTPDIFLELLFRFSLNHANPFVRKYVYHTILVTLAKRIRWSEEFLFVPSAPAISTENEPHSDCILHILSTATYSSVLPPHTAITAFWQSQFNLLHCPSARRHFIHRFLTSLVERDIHPNQNHSLGLHLFFLAHLTYKGGQEDLYLSSDELLPNLYALARNVPTVTPSVNRSELFESLSWIFLRYTNIGQKQLQSYDSTLAASELGEIGRVLTTVVPAHMKQRSHPFHQRLSQICQSNDWFGLTLVPLINDFLTVDPNRLSSPTIIHTDAAHLIALYSLLPIQESTTMNIARRILTSLSQAISRGSVEGLERSLEMVSNLLLLLTNERASVQSISPFQQAMSTLSKGHNQSSCVHPSATSTQASPLDQLFGSFFASQESDSLFHLLRTQLLAVAATTTQPTSSYLRGLCFQLFSQVVQAYPMSSTHRQLMNEIVQDCCQQLMPNSSIAPNAPILECQLLYTIYNLLHECYQARHITPFNLSDFLSPEQYLRLLVLLASSTLPTRLVSKSLYASDPASPHSPEEPKGNYTLNGQLVRWGLLRVLLDWTLASCHQQRPIDLLKKTESSSNSYATVLFQQTPSFFHSTFLPSILNSLDGAMIDYWSVMVDCITRIVSLEQSFSQQVEWLFNQTQTYDESQQQILLTWLPTKLPLLPELPGIFERVWRSFQDVSKSKMAAPSSALEMGEQPLVWLDWCELPSAPQISSSTTGDHPVPALYLSFVDLFLHRSFFSNQSTNIHTQLKRHLGLLIALARKRGYRTLLYATAFRCIEIFAENPRLATNYLPELTSLLTIQRRINGNETDQEEADGDRHGHVRASTIPMEQLIRVLILSLFEHLTKIANSYDPNAVTANPLADDVYFFLTHALHHFLHFNLYDMDYAVSQCGGENGAVAGENGNDDTINSSAVTGTPNQSSAHYALTAIWHALCILSTLRLRPYHCLPSNEDVVQPAEQTSSSVMPKPQIKKKTQKLKLQELQSQLRTVPPAFSFTQSMPSEFPLLYYISRQCFVLLISPSLPSSLRHLIELFLINYLLTNLTPDSTLLEHTLLPYLDRTLYRQNIVCSFLVVTGFICSKLQQREFQQQLHLSQESVNLVESFHPIIQQLFSKLHIWTQSPLGQIRTIAQYFFYHLFLEVYHHHLFLSDGRTILPKGMKVQPGLAATTTTTNTQEITITSTPLTINDLSFDAKNDVVFRSIYYPLFLFLYRSNQLATLRTRQDIYFRSFQPFTRTTVEGLIKYARAYDASQRSHHNATVDESEDASSAESTSNDAGASETLLQHVGSELPNEDLLHHLRMVTSEFLDTLRQEREFDYYSDRTATTAQTHQTSNVHVWRPNQDTTATLANSTDGVLNFQQKIAPLKTQLLEAATTAHQTEVETVVPESLPSSISSSSPVLPPHKHLILCASLVSKAVNLGGLCRTAEIMHCSLVVEDERILNDPTFVNVSSTANRWVDITVVGKIALVDWLLSKKQDGYTVIGLEQTPQSTPLQEFTFPDRVILVLGNEKQGLPVSILTLLDACIIIPQFGLIRSLNVHVSGGMVLWEWIKQCLGSSKVLSLT